MSSPFLGQIMQVGFNFPPRGWATCDGQILPIAQNTALFSLLGTTFGGDGQSTFGLPNLLGRSAVHVGTGAGLSNISWGERSGSETLTLTTPNLPAHSHSATLKARDAGADTGSPTGNSLAIGQDANRNPTDLYSTDAPDVDMNAGSIAVANTGSAQSMDIRNPFLGIYHCIAIVGTFPSRN